MSAYDLVGRHQGRVREATVCKLGYLGQSIELRLNGQ